MSFRITILAHGSRGDVQPYVALGRGLQEAGYQVRLACPARFEAFIVENGLEFAPLAGDPTGMARELAEKAGASFLKTIPAMLSYTMPLAVQIVADCRQACQGADGIIHSFLMTVPGHETALAMDLPELSALIFGVFSPTGAFPNPMFPSLPLGSGYNRITHHIFDRSYWHGGRLGYAWLRRKYAHLPALHGWPFAARPKRGNPRPLPVLYGLSPSLLPRPADWGDHLHMTGSWFLDSPDWTPPAKLLAFLEAGPPPIFIGFGSTITSKAKALTRIALEALALTHQRGLLLTGWGGLDQVNLPPSVLAIESAPFDRLFPHMAALVHHGGMGTTADGLRAGKPAVIVPFTTDQPFWGRHLHRLGLSPAPIPPKKLTAQRLAAGIHDTIENEARRRRVQRMGQSIRAEDGAGRAVALVTRYLASGAA